MDQSITKDFEKYSEETLLKEYSTEDQEQIKIDKTNSKTVFSPKFIPVYPSLLKDFTPTEVIIFGFIDFYTSNNSNRFYFTNEQIAKIASCSVDTASKSIIKLHKKGLLNVSRKVRAGGGQIRFIKPTKENPESNYGKSLVATKEKHRTNKNKINNNKIKEYISLFNSLFNSSFRETKGRVRKLEARLNTYEFQDILKALKNLSKSKFHQGNNDRNWKADPDFLIRSDEQIDKWLNNVIEEKKEKLIDYELLKRLEQKKREIGIID